LFIILAGVY